PSERTIKCLNVDGILRLSSNARNSHRSTNHPDWQKEGYVGVRGALNFKTCFFNNTTKFRHAITTPVITYFVLQTPEKHEGRHEQEHVSTLAEYTRELTQTCKIIIEVFNDVECCDQIKTVVFERQFFRGT